MTNSVYINRKTIPEAKFMEIELFFKGPTSYLQHFMHKNVLKTFKSHQLHKKLISISHLEHSLIFIKGHLMSNTAMCLHFGTPKTINFPFGTNGKSIILSVPILKHTKVVYVFDAPE